jgi:hypothetical protein
MEQKIQKYMLTATAIWFSIKASKTCWRKDNLFNKQYWEN